MFLLSFILYFRRTYLTSFVDFYIKFNPLPDAAFKKSLVEVYLESPNSSEPFRSELQSLHQSLSKEGKYPIYIIHTYIHRLPILDVISFVVNLSHVYYCYVCMYCMYVVRDTEPPSYVSWLASAVCMEGLRASTPRDWATGQRPYHASNTSLGGDEGRVECGGNTLAEDSPVGSHKMGLHPDTIPDVQSGSM